METLLRYEIWDFLDDLTKCTLMRRLNKSWERWWWERTYKVYLENRHPRIEGYGGGYLVWCGHVPRNISRWRVNASTESFLDFPIYLKIFSCRVCMICRKDMFPIQYNDLERFRCVWAERTVVSVEEFRHMVLSQETIQHLLIE